MTKAIQYIALTIVLLVSCSKNQDTLFNASVEIAPTYSVPIGNFSLEMNNYFFNLFNITQPWPDSVFFNDTLLPNPYPVVTRFESYPINLNSITESFDDIKLLLIRLVFYNGYPVGIKAKVQLLGANGDVVMTLDSPEGFEIRAAEINTDQQVVEEQKHVFDIRVPDDQISALQNVRFAATVYEISTTVDSPEKLKFYEYYRIKLHIGARFQIAINP